METRSQVRKRSSIGRRIMKWEDKIGKAETPTQRCKRVMRQVEIEKRNQILRIARMKELEEIRKKEEEKEENENPVESFEQKMSRWKSEMFSTRTEDGIIKEMLERVTVEEVELSGAERKDDKGTENEPEGSLKEQVAETSFQRMRRIKNEKRQRMKEMSMKAMEMLNKRRKAIAEIKTTPEYKFKMRILEEREEKKRLEDEDEDWMVLKMRKAEERRKSNEMEKKKERERRRKREVAEEREKIKKEQEKRMEMKGQKEDEKKGEKRKSMAERMLKVECDDVEIVNELPQPTTREEALKWMLHVPEVRRKSLPKKGMIFE